VPSYIPPEPRVPSQQEPIQLFAPVSAPYDALLPLPASSSTASVEQNRPDYPATQRPSDSQATGPQKFSIFLDSHESSHTSESPPTGPTSATKSTKNQKRKANGLDATSGNKRRKAVQRDPLGDITEINKEREKANKRKLTRPKRYGE
jgi:hypothetical protein